MNGETNGNHETVIDLLDRIKRSADELQHKDRSPQDIRLEICSLTRKARKKLICAVGKIGGDISGQAAETHSGKKSGRDDAAGTGG